MKERYELGKIYKISRIYRTKKINHFEGELILITDNHMTFKNQKHGFCETFKPVDFRIMDYSIQEVQ